MLTTQYTEDAKGKRGLHSGIPGVSWLKYLLAFLGPAFSFFPVLGLLLFLGAMFWAKAQDPFTRHWFTLKTPEHQAFQCVTVLPKPVRRCPVVVYAHGSGGSLMTDGNDLRQMAELGLATVSLEYDQTNEDDFASEFTTLRQYVARQPWADTDAIAWVGYSLGANRTLAYALQISGAQTSNAGSSRGGGGLPDENGSKSGHLAGQKAGVSGDFYDAAPGDGRTPGFGRDTGHEAQIKAVGPPQLLVLILGGNEEGRMQNEETGRARQTAPGAGALPRTVRVLLIHGDQDELFPVADTQRLADEWQTNGQPVTLRILPGLSHTLDLERGVIFRAIGEYCLTHLGDPNAWQHYQSIALWQAEAPALLWFWLPAVGWILLRLSKVGRASVGNEEGRMMPGPPEGEGSQARGARPGARGEDPNRQSRWTRASAAAPGAGALPGLRFTILHSVFILRLVAFVLATCALTETALHLVPPYLVISDGGTPGEGAGPTSFFFLGRINTLGLARRFLVQPKERADFEWLAARPIWSGAKLRTLLDHVELAVYNRELINWTLDDAHYRDYVLNPVIAEENEEGRMMNEEIRGPNDSVGTRFAAGARQTAPGAGALPGLRFFTDHSSFIISPLAWRRPLWEEFYPRIRHENSVADAVPIVVRHLRERVTIASLPNLPRDVPTIWLKQITDEAGFQIIYVAALRSVGVPARLVGADGVEFWDGARWQAAPAPAVTTWQASL